MTLDDFKSSLDQTSPNPELTGPLRALWLDAQGRWTEAHDLVDQGTTKQAYWVHAYLHRKEGEDWNARYWYRQAERPACAASLDEEWEQIAAELLSLEYLPRR